jgi:rhamnogalacturonyl hydrolase YesR
MHMNNGSAELVIVFPATAPPGESREFVGQCLNYGIDIYFEDGDSLPSHVPAAIEDVRAIVIDGDQYEQNREAIRAYEAVGARLYIFRRSLSAVIPQLPSPWKNGNAFHHVIFDSALTVDSPNFRQKMCARDDNFLLKKIGERMLETNDLRWYDSTCYNWKGLLDIYEVTGDPWFLKTAEEQIGQAIREQENDLQNCDRLAPFVQVLRLYELNCDNELLDYAREKIDRYIEITPTYKGCFVNFAQYTGHVRSEIIFQVCPALMWLSKVTGKRHYADVALDQFKKLHELLYSPETGLWNHGANDRGVSGACWARGMAYSFWGIFHILELTDPRNSYYAKLDDIFQNMARRIREMQDESGFWFQVVDNPQSEKESSGTAWTGAVFERAMRLGYLDQTYRPHADAAWDAVKSRVWRGHFPGNGSGTTISPLYAYYLKKNLATRGWTHFACAIACERQRTALAQALEHSLQEQPQ